MDFTSCHVGGIQHMICCITIKVNLYNFKFNFRRYEIYITIIFIARDLDALAFKICNQLRSTNPQHPMFMYGYNLKCMVRNGQSNIDHDLYKEADAMIVLECISKVLFCDLKMLCSCTQTLDCYLLNKV